MSWYRKLVPNVSNGSAPDSSYLDGLSVGVSPERRPPGEALWTGTICWRS
jgi:hypothetical protein